MFRSSGRAMVRLLALLANALLACCVLVVSAAMFRSFDGACFGIPFWAMGPVYAAIGTAGAVGRFWRWRNWLIAVWTGAFGHAYFWCVEEFSVSLDYDIWLRRGMPGPPPWADAFLVGAIGTYASGLVALWWRRRTHP